MEQITGPVGLPRLPAVAFVTVSEFVAYQPSVGDGTDAGGAESHFEYRVDREARPDVIRAEADSNWPLLAPGCRVKGPVGMVVVENVEGKNPTRVPTAEEAAATEAKVIEIGMLGVRFARVRPGRSARFEPADLAAMTVYCENGPARYVVTVFPR